MYFSVRVVYLHPVFCCQQLMLLRIGSLLFFALLLYSAASAQPNVPVYSGYRISLFDVSIKKQKSESLSLKLSVANTGRLPVALGKKTEEMPESLIVELDTVKLPPMLRGREQLLSDAIRQEKINLLPGEIMRDLSLDLKIKSLDTPPDTPEGCPDLMLDTAYIVQYTDKAMSLRFVVRNVGNATAQLLGATDSLEDNLAINVYFTSGTKLTRGSILADGVFVQKGRETLDGMLLPGHFLQGDIEISLSKRTAFMPNLVFELDPFHTVRDCSRANNTKAVVVEF